MPGSGNDTTPQALHAASRRAMAVRTARWAEPTNLAERIPTHSRPPIKLPRNTDLNSEATESRPSGGQAKSQDTWNGLEPELSEFGVRS